MKECGALQWEQLDSKSKTPGTPVPSGRHSDQRLARGDLPVVRRRHLQRRPGTGRRASGETPTGSVTGRPAPANGGRSRRADDSDGKKPVDIAAPGADEAIRPGPGPFQVEERSDSAVELRIPMMEPVVLADLAVEPNASHVGGFRLGFLEESHGDGELERARHVGRRA